VNASAAGAASEPIDSSPAEQSTHQEDVNCYDVLLRSHFWPTTAEDGDPEL